MGIKKKLQYYFKNFFYKFFLLFYGKIEKIVFAEKDSRIKIEHVLKENSINYKVFLINQGRLYTDRIQDTAVIVNNSIISGPSHQLRSFNNSDVEENIILKIGTPRFKKKLNGTVLSLLTGGAGNENYWHWLYDVLPRLALCEQVVNLDEIDFFLAPALDKKFQKESLKLLKLKKSKLISSKQFRHIQTSKLIVTDHPYCINNDATNDIMNIPFWISDWLKIKFSKFQVTDNDLPKNIFIDRSDSEADIQQTRKIINENEVINFLDKKNFKVLTLSKYDFKEQIKFFYNAENIIGLHGAGFGNISFCKPNTKIVEFKNNNQVKAIENLAYKNSLVYKSIICEPLRYKFNNQQGHINIPLSELEKKINE